MEQVVGSSVRGIARSQSGTKPQGSRQSPDVALSDATLAARAVHDPHALSLLYRTYLDPVYRYCAHRLNSREDAEDATSQIFTKMLAGLPSYRGEDAFRSWLFAIAHNVVIDMYRRQRPTAPLELAADTCDLAPSPEELAVRGESEHIVTVLLAQLTPEQARVLELRLAGLKEGEIAAVLDRRPGAVRALQFRALTRLRQSLATAGAVDGLAHD